jgi:hypothetical protein
LAGITPNSGKIDLAQHLSDAVRKFPGSVSPLPDVIVLYGEKHRLIKLYPDNETPLSVSRINKISGNNQLQNLQLSTLKIIPFQQEVHLNFRDLLSSWLLICMKYYKLYSHVIIIQNIVSSGSIKLVSHKMKMNG